ncbi:4-alpha-glucanotransferase [bacterium]|nr:MAG: 4-alpha-glucanotransferase [bacterium]
MDDKLVGLLNTASATKWQRAGLNKRAGICMPLFSVYSNSSVGIGDFKDLELAIDFCVKSGISIIQLLPMNELGPLFCPYDSLSSFALEPVFLSLKDLSMDSDFLGRIESTRDLYPTGKPHIDYEIKNEKIRLLWDIYLQQSLDNLEFKEFLSDNSYWIEDFALFKVIKDDCNGLPWYDWEDDYKNRDPGVLNIFKEEHRREILFQKWLQWLSFRQFKNAQGYARSKGILIKGDLPILVSRDSADVWAHKDFFKLEFAAGAPPDMYCAKGQRWGMPTYNWENIAADNYQYLKERLKYAEQFYDMLRIDHVVGLFRIWSIPYHEPRENQGLNGSFDPVDEGRWRQHGRNILSVMLNSTSMLLCAEDLGVIPGVCTDTLKELGVPGNDVQRWVKDWNVRHDFLLPEEYRFLSVAMLSTHDTTCWQAWWENEAGTVDEALFMRKCHERGIDYTRAKEFLFDPLLSRHGRLRWKDSVNSPDILIQVMGRKKEELMDFVDMYENTYREKEKLWSRLGFKPPMQEHSNLSLLKSALGITLAANSIFSIDSVFDWIGLTGTFKDDHYKYRINIPGTINLDNWSLVLPVSLDQILKSSICDTIKEMVYSANRC